MNARRLLLILWAASLFAQAPAPVPAPPAPCVTKALPRTRGRTGIVPQTPPPTLARATGRLPRSLP